MDNLIAHMKRFVDLDTGKEKAILSRAMIFSVEKKEILETQDTLVRHMYFVNSGCLHLYRITEKGREQTLQFAIKNWWLTDYDSFNSQQPSMYQIQALETSEVVALSKSNLDSLFAEVPEMERYFRLIAQRAYAASLYRISLMFNFSKEERYLGFIRRYPEFVKQVPQYVLGSYLGISPEYISEVRKKQTGELS